MGAATAFQALKRSLDLRFGRLLLLVEEGGGRHDPAIDAVAALRHLLFHIGGLQRMRLLRAPEAGERYHLTVPHGRNRRHAGADCLPVEMDGARAALRKAAAEMGIVEADV